MEGPMHYRPSGPPPINGAHPRLVHFPRISNESPPVKRETDFPLQRKSSRGILDILPFLRSRRSSRAFLLNSDSEFPEKAEKKRPLKPIIQRPLISKMESRVQAEPYLWPHEGTLDPKTTALVIIDMQKDFCSPEGYLVYQGYDITPVRAVIPRIQSLLFAFRSHGFPIYHTREGHRPDLSTLSPREAYRSANNASGLGIGSKGPLGRLLIRGEDGHSIVPELAPLSNENIIDKPGRSAFQHTEFKLMLGIKGIKNLIICGVTTDVCVHSTMREANDNGFDCLLIEDACSASEEHLHTAAVEMVKTEGGIFGAVSTTDKVLVAVEGKLERDGIVENVKPGKLVAVSTEPPFVFP